MSELEAATFPDTPEAWLASLGDAQPLHTTLPTPGAPNELAAVEMVAKMLGTPLLPWQRFVTRVLTEKRPDGSYRYKTALLTVPRQSGKTTLFRTILTARCLRNPNRRAFITAQTGKDARERLFELADTVALSVIGSTVRVRRAAETPRIEFNNKSRLQSFPPTPESLHGYTLADCVLDEIFAFSEIEGELLLGAITPAQQTIKDRQMLMCSTMGTADSVFLNNKVRTGQESLTDPDTQTAYFQWSLGAGLDPFEPDNWDWHPGLAAGLIEKEDISSAAEDMSPGEFVRAYMNTLTLTSESLFDVEAWHSSMSEMTIPSRGEVAIAYEVSANRRRAAIVAAWKTDGYYYVKLIRNGYGTSWLPEALEQLHAANPLAIGCDKYAQNMVIHTDMQTLLPELEIHTLTPESFKTATAAFQSRIEDKRIRHNGHPALTASVNAAVSRKMGEGFVVSHLTEKPEVIAALTACRLLDEVKPETQPFFLLSNE